MPRTCSATRRLTQPGAELKFPPSARLCTPVQSACLAAAVAEHGKTVRRSPISSENSTARRLQPLNHSSRRTGAAWLQKPKDSAYVCASCAPAMSTQICMNGPDWPTLKNRSLGGCGSRQTRWCRRELGVFDAKRLWSCLVLCIAQFDPFSIPAPPSACGDS